MAGGTADAAGAAYWSRFASISGAVFVFWLAHDAVQEWVFNLQGYRFGGVMALVTQVACVVLAPVEAGVSALCARRAARPPESAAGVEAGGAASAGPKGGGEGQERQQLQAAKEPVSVVVLGLHVVALSAMLSISAGAANTALLYVQQPVKVLFKSSKLLPTMVVRVLIGNTSSYTPTDYGFAAMLCAGLAVFSLGDSKESGVRFEMVGVALLLTSVCCDSIVPNLQERLLRRYGLSQSTLTFHTNWVSIIITLSFIVWSGEFEDAYYYLQEREDACWALFIISLVGFGGIQFYLLLIAHAGSTATLIVTSVRKMITIALSFGVVARKPFNWMHACGMLLVFSVTVVGKSLVSRGAPAKAPAHAAAPAAPAATAR